MARKFFYVCAGLFLLALSYQLGVTTAHGQAGATVADADDPGLGSYAVTSSGAVYLSQYGSILAIGPRWNLIGTIPTSSPIVHIEHAGDSGGQSVAHAFAENGDFYVSADGGRTWSLHGNVFGSPTPALHESWGSLKSRFAPKSTPAPGTPTDR
jgi:hypothetical protein